MRPTSARPRNAIALTIIQSGDDHSHDHCSHSQMSVTAKITIQRGGTATTARNGSSQIPYCGESTRPSTM